MGGDIGAGSSQSKSTFAIGCEFGEVTRLSMCEGRWADGL